jgi:hypothetical protein
MVPGLFKPCSVQQTVLAGLCDSRQFHNPAAGTSIHICVTGIFQLQQNFGEMKELSEVAVSRII